MFFRTEKDRFGLEIVTVVSDDKNFVDLHSEEWQESSKEAKPGDYYYNGDFIKPGGAGYEPIQEIIHNIVEQETAAEAEKIKLEEEKQKAEMLAIAAQQSVEIEDLVMPEPRSVDECKEDIKKLPTPKYAKISAGEVPLGADDPISFPESTEENLVDYTVRLESMKAIKAVIPTSSYNDYVITFKPTLVLAKGTDNEHIMETLLTPDASLEEYAAHVDLVIEDLTEIVNKIKSDLGK